MGAMRKQTAPDMRLVLAQFAIDAREPRFGAMTPPTALLRPGLNQPQSQALNPAPAASPLNGVGGGSTSRAQRPGENARVRRPQKARSRSMTTAYDFSFAKLDG